MVQFLDLIAITKREIMKPGKPQRPDNKSFRIDRLVDLMRTRGLNQGDLAHHLGIYPSQVSKWLTGVNTPSIDTLVRIAKFFRVSTDYLTGLIDENQALYQVPELSPDEWAFILSIRDGSFAQALKKLADEMTKREQEGDKKGSETT